MSSARSKLVVVLVATALAGCSARRADPSLAAARSRIVGGQVDDADPAVVEIWIGDGDCTGTLISPKVVLTAAHCFEGASAAQMQVFFGTDSSQDGSWFSVIHAEAHPTGDIAALTMDTAGPAAPVPLSKHAFVSGDEGAPVRIAGFGVTTETGNDSGLKRQTTTQLAQWDSDFVYLDGSSKDTCYGDSGGPAFMTFGGIEQLVGVTSFGTATCGNEMSGETRVDAFRSWVVDYMSQHDVAPESVPSCDADGECAVGCPKADPDCPCASDGFCTAACADPATDPDCPACGADGVCQAGCPTLDPDCCGSDTWCNPACPGNDPDCASAPAAGAGGSAPTPKAAPVPPDSASSGCSIGRRAAAAPWWSALLALGFGWLVRRRKSRRGRAAADSVRSRAANRSNPSAR